MCLIPKCLKLSSDRRFLGWGSGGKLCTEHYDAIRDYLVKKGNGDFQIDAQYLDDYIRIKCLMIEKDTIMKQLEQLGREASTAAVRNQSSRSTDDIDDRFRSAKESTGYIRVSRVLEYFESLCWFPSCHRVFSGGLTAADFYYYVSRGIMVKDPGPNYMHGDFTHRLQWHALMRIITNDFTVERHTPWNKTPLELYTSMGVGAARAANIWGSILDRDDASPVDLPQIASLAQAKTFSYPNTLHQEVLKKVGGILGQNLNRRFNKRQGLVLLAEKHANAWLAGLPRNQQEGIRFAGAFPAGYEIAAVLYALKKRGGRPLEIARNLEPYPEWSPKSGVAIQAHKRLQEEHNARLRLENAEKVAIRVWNAEIRDQSEAPVAPYRDYKSSHGTVYKRVQSPDSKTHGVIFAQRNGHEVEQVTEADIAQRIANSRIGLNPLFTYSSKIGAYPRAAE